MRHTIAAGLIAASSFAAAAQTASEKPAATAQPRKPAAIVGCLAAGPTQGVFTLTTTEAEVKAEPGSGASTGSAPKPDVKTVIYTLTATPGVNLQTHAGHTVEVVGTEPPSQPPSDSPEKTRASTGEQTKPTGQANATPEIVARQLTVSSVRTVARSCRIRK